MFRKITPFTVKGVIWYQGESNAHQAGLYKKIFTAMIQNWRDDLENSSLPFLFVQLAPFKGWYAENDTSWASLREAQLDTLKSVNNTAMVVITDCGESNNIHPRNKKTVGERLAAAARGMVYGENIEYSGPIFRDMKIEGKNAILYFDHVGKGLTFIGEEPLGFEICGREGVYLKADVCIKGNTIVASNPEIDEPYGVRYGWSNFPEVNFYNIDGFPASPFRAFRGNKSS